MRVKTNFEKYAVQEGLEFIGSYTDVRNLPKWNLPEIVLCGRSNVGKSSLLNCLSGRRKKVAVTSKTPGRTRTMNLYKVGEALTIMDLPGYGYAKVGAEMQKDWRRYIEQYLSKRQNLVYALLLVDVQREPQELDIQLIEALDSIGLQCVVVATKADKCKPQQLEDSLLQLQEAFALEGVPLAFSSTTSQGRNKLWKQIENACREAKKL